MAECVSPSPTLERQAQPFISVWILLAAFLLAVFVLHSGAEAFWTYLECHTETLAGTLANQIIEQVIGQGLVVVMTAVAVIIGVPLLLAWLAFAASAIAFDVKSLHRSS